MHLTSMSDAFIKQTNAPKMKDVSFEDRFGLLVDIEYNKRKSNSTEHQNLFITSTIGSGKTYMACAFGMETCQ